MNEMIKHAKIGEIVVGKNDEILRATLGSCVGIAFLWRERSKFGLAHCLLPEAPKITYSIGAKYVSQAIPSMMSLLHIKSDEAPLVDVYLVGGSNMNNAGGKGGDIGRQNIEVAKELVLTQGFNLVRVETGHECALQVDIHCIDATVSIAKIVDHQRIMVV